MKSGVYKRKAISAKKVDDNDTLVVRESNVIIDFVDDCFEESGNLMIYCMDLAFEMLVGSFELLEYMIYAFVTPVWGFVIWSVLTCFIFPFDWKLGLILPLVITFILRRNPSNIFYDKTKFENKDGTEKSCESIWYKQKSYNANIEDKELYEAKEI